MVIIWQKSGNKVVYLWQNNGNEVAMEWQSIGNDAKQNTINHAIIIKNLFKTLDPSRGKFGML